ncbi:hypothetical protein [Arthrobacter humicola]
MKTNLVSLREVPRVDEQFEVDDPGDDGRGQLGEAHVDGAFEAAAAERLQGGLRESGDANFRACPGVVAYVRAQRPADLLQRTGQVLQQLVSREIFAGSGFLTVLRGEL